MNPLMAVLAPPDSQMAIEAMFLASLVPIPKLLLGLVLIPELLPLLNQSLQSHYLQVALLVLLSPAVGSGLR